MYVWVPLEMLGIAVKHLRTFVYVMDDDSYDGDHLTAIFYRIIPMYIVYFVVSDTLI